jgi:hypothetical protein
MVGPHRAKLVEAAKHLRCETTTASVVAACEQAADQISDRVDLDLTPDERLVALADHYGVELNVVYTTSELDSFVDEQAARGDYGFVTRRARFDDDLLAAVMRRRKPDPDDRTFVALIDGRGHKEPMAFFSETHEVAHPVLEPQLAFDFRDESKSRNPWEGLVDRVGSAMVFRGRQWADAVGVLMPLASGLTFGSLRPLRDRMAPRASLTATLIAAANTAGRAILVVHARAGSSRSDPAPVLRVGDVTPNHLAENQATFLHRKRRIPRSSPLAIAFETGRDAAGFEDLASWLDGSGNALRARTVWTAATPTGGGGVLGVVDFGVSEP